LSNIYSHFQELHTFLCTPWRWLRISAETYCSNLYMGWNMQRIKTSIVIRVEVN
jgi:hypothetical protein